MPTAQNLFEITIDESEPPIIAYGEKCLKGFIQIGAFVERFNVPVEEWHVADYKQQWREGIERVLAGVFPACLVVGMRDPLQGVFINTWPMYADHDNVVFQNKILLCKQIRKRFTGHNFYDFIEPRETCAEDDEPISEWVVSRNSVAKFLKMITSPLPVTHRKARVRVSVPAV